MATIKEKETPANTGNRFDDLKLRPITGDSILWDGTEQERECSVCKKMFGPDYVMFSGVTGDGTLKLYCTTECDTIGRKRGDFKAD